ncbi:hypothetical protein [Thermocatellispora tengchongensis]|uniref:hypothetical protein n=1 Tax=Thermocatellispora tengchongensis TaxID=1073253 RepID=UPI0036443450
MLSRVFGVTGRILGGIGLHFVSPVVAGLVAAGLVLAYGPFLRLPRYTASSCAAAPPACAPVPRSPAPPAP